jgi:nitroimidazol reductase NimA-like FMN-containing flavoprotein (pyridoxamine 5'-phosphate oxidase superfamily)
MTEQGREPIERLTEDRSWDFLARHHLGRIAMERLGEPEIFPVNYILDGRRIVFRAAPGTKLWMARAGARVAFEVDEASELFETGTSVVVHGTLHEVLEERDRLAKLPLRTWASGRDHYLAVDAARISGRAIVPHHDDDGLLADGG